MRPLTTLFSLNVIQISSKRKLNGKPLSCCLSDQMWSLLAPSLPLHAEATAGRWVLLFDRQCALCRIAPVKSKLHLCNFLTHPSVDNPTHYCSHLFLNVMCVWTEHAVLNLITFRASIPETKCYAKCSHQETWRGKCLFSLGTRYRNRCKCLLRNNKL